jgi:AhpD family alkylhydroperoxidase
VLDLAMRGESDWTNAERELFAAFVSSLNQCLF